MSSGVDPSFLLALFESTPGDALAIARRTAASPPPHWKRSHWLQIADGASSNAIIDPDWLILAVFAYEQFGGSVLTGLRYRADTLVRLGVDATDDLRDPAVLFARATEVIGDDDVDRALRAFAESARDILTLDTESEAWTEAKDALARGRDLRRLGKILKQLLDARLDLPRHLVPWAIWAEVKEEGGGVIIPKR